MDELVTIGFPLIVDRAQIERGYSEMQSLWLDLFLLIPNI